MDQNIKHVLSGPRAHDDPGALPGRTGALEVERSYLLSPDGPPVLLEPPEETIAKLQAKVGQVIEEQVGIEERRAGYFAELVGVPVGSSWSDIEGAIRKLQRSDPGARATARPGRDERVT